MHKVFVFGTLKEGFPNFSKNNGVRHGGDYVTRECFPLYLVGERYSPWLVLAPGTHPVFGQVFSVSDEALALMDRLERVHEADGYQRVRITVICVESGAEEAVFVYGKSPDLLRHDEIQMELAGEYLLEHAALYRPR